MTSRQKGTAALLGVIAWVAFAGQAHAAQCEQDWECGIGKRCVQSTCVDAAAAPSLQPALPPAAPPPGYGPPPAPPPAYGAPTPEVPPAGYGPPQPAPAWPEAAPAQPVAPAPTSARPASDAPAAAGADAVQAKGAKGLQFALPGGTVATFGGAYFVSEKGALRVDLGLVLGLTPAVNFNFSLAVGYRAYLARAGSLWLFAQPGVLLENLGSGFSAALTGAVGAEFFINQNVSVGGTAGGLLRAASNFGSIGLTLGGTSLFAAAYF